MKCATAIMSSSSVCPVALSIRARNHAGVVGSKNETSHTSCPRTVSVPSTRASETADQNGTGWRIGGSCTERTQRLCGVARSQRELPMMIDAEWPLIVYESPLGDFAL